MADVPAWLDTLVEVVREAMETPAPSGVGLRFREDACLGRDDLSAPG